MRTFAQLSNLERHALQELRGRITAGFPQWGVRIILFGSRARGDAEPDSDMDILVDVETETLAFADKQRLRRIVSEVSMSTGIVISMLAVDQRLKREKGDYSIFENIREEGIPV
jgi:predicted nucleotidyltransferase